VNALNFDGGGSTVMLVHDSIVSHPSDKTGERAVANAVVVLGGGER
jgi:exopolysaccharide biosynthesis protein